MGDMKDKLLISFSGGETSGYMAQWLWNHWQEIYEMVFVFANTGEENEETLKFVQKCSDHFGFPVVWVESVVHHSKRKGCTHKVVDFNTASRRGEPFEEVIRKYGIPNMSFIHCTRELKSNPILSFAKSLGWKNHYTAIGIRSDEFDRMSVNAKAMRFIYPLIKNVPMTKQKINLWWSQQPFRLNLKGYQGNCKVCHKKSDPKLYQIAKEKPEHFDFTKRMESKYPRTGSEFQKYNDQPDRKFFRKHRSTIDILKESKEWEGKIIDDSEDYSVQCEVFTDCGIDN